MENLERKPSVMVNKLKISIVDLIGLSKVLSRSLMNCCDEIKTEDLSSTFFLIEKQLSSVLDMTNEVQYTLEQKGE